VSLLDAITQAFTPKPEKTIAQIRGEIEIEKAKADLARAKAERMKAESEQERFRPSGFLGGLRGINIPQPKNYFGAEGNGKGGNGNDGN
jgi:hypothetical protein